MKYSYNFTYSIIHDFVGLFAIFDKYQISNTKKPITDLNFQLLLILLVYLQLLINIITLTQKKYGFNVIYKLSHL